MYCEVECGSHSVQTKQQIHCLLKADSLFHGYTLSKVNLFHSVYTLFTNNPLKDVKMLTDYYRMVEAFIRLLSERVEF